MKSLNLKSYLGDNVVDWCDKILVDAERLDNSRELKPKNSKYITCTFEYDYDSGFIFWGTRSTRRIRILLRKFVCVTMMS